MRKRIIIIIVCIFVVSITLISVGLYINFLSKPKKILEKSISFIHDQGKIYLFPSEDLLVGDTYTIESNIDYNLNSEFYLRDSKNNPDSLKKYHFIKNLSKMDTEILYKQDSNNNTSYMEINENIGDEKILGYKRLVKDSTEYYFVNGIVKNYVNNGTCNYFEALSEENTTRSNIDYLYDFVFKSLQNNMKDEYFKEYDVVENVNSKSTNVRQISIKFTNKNTREILNNILKDLKKDEKTNNILSNVYMDFKDYKVKNNTSFFDKNESYTLNIYTSKVLSKPLKYEVIHINGDLKENYIIENNGDKLDYYYLEDSKVKYNASISFMDDTIKAKIYNSSNEEIGELHLEKKNNNTIFEYNFDNSEEKIDINYSSMYTKVKNNKSYINTKKLDIKYLVNKESKLTGDITLISNVSKDAKIDEEINSPVLYNKLSDEDKNKIDNLKDRVKERLEK